jgi:hypothetical protein
MYFTEEALAQLAEGLGELDEKYLQIYEPYLTRAYVSDRGREFGQQGFARRLQSLKRCIERIYEILPPESEDHPDDDARHDAELIVQAFVFHIFGAADNLAWIWVCEKNIRRANGVELAESAVGIRKEAVRRSFTDRFRALLDERADWFTYLESFRHSLAHRIPLYIPPYVVTHANEAAYHEFDVRMAQAAARGDFRERENLKWQQKELTSFRPWMQHSFVEEAHPMVFHVQMLADFNTVHEMALMLLDDLA